MDEYVDGIKQAFIDDIVGNGFDRNDTEMLINKGLYSLDKFLIF